MRRIAAAVSMALAILAGGCSTFPRIDPALSSNVANLRIDSATVLETTMELTVRLQNASPEPIRVEGGAFKLYLNEAFVGRGVSGQPLEVPRFGEAAQAVTLRVSNLSVMRRLRPILDTQRVAYRLDSTLYGRGRAWTKRYRLTDSGSVDVKEFQGAAIPSPARP